MQDLTVEQFARHVNESFTVNGEARTPLVLVEAAERGGARPGGRQRFVLLFHGPPAPVLPQATYRFEHPAFPSLEIFIVPVGPEGDRMRYEAVFA